MCTNTNRMPAPHFSTQLVCERRICSYEEGLHSIECYQAGAPLTLYLRVSTKEVAMSHIVSDDTTARLIPGTIGTKTVTIPTETFYEVVNALRDGCGCAKCLDNANTLLVHGYTPRREVE